VQLYITAKLMAKKNVMAKNLEIIEPRGSLGFQGVQWIFGTFVTETEPAIYTTRHPDFVGGWVIVIDTGFSVFSYVLYGLYTDPKYRGPWGSRGSRGSGEWGGLWNPEGRPWIRDPWTHPATFGPARSDPSWRL